jgi:Zn-dependent protease with chaperone function
MRFRRHEEAALQSTQRLLVLFVALVLALVVLVNVALALVWWALVPFAKSLPNHFVAANTAFVLLYVLGGWAVESSRLSGGGIAVARLAGARAAQPGRGSALSRLEQRFVNVVQEMAIASGQRPAPAAWVLPSDDAVNALAAGWRAEDAVVAVTRGALERLTREELQGVVAHEVGHLVHGDSRLNMRLVGMVWGLQLIWNLGQALMAPDDRGRLRAVFPLGVVLLAVGALGWLAGRLLQAAVSRQREFLADATAVKFARMVDGLGGALRKIADQQTTGHTRLVGLPASHLDHLLLTPSSLLGQSHAWLATHPPLAERIARLYGHAQEPIEARVLPEPPDAEPLHPALLSLHSTRSDAVIGVAIPRNPEAHRNDALQRPTHYDNAARETDALRRIDLWHGPGEWQAAMLALAIGDVQDADVWRAYQDATADLSVAAGVREQVQCLGAAKRREVFALMLQRAAAATPSSRRALWRRWLTRWQALRTGHAAEALRLIVMRHGLAPRAGVAQRGTLATQSRAVHAATRAMALCLGASATEQQQWLTAAWAALQEMELPAPRGPGLGLAPLTQPRERMVALRVRRLSPMQRPLLLRAWTGAARSTGLLSRTATADALHLACLALDVAPARDVLQPSSV